jgi:hypothetical protein
MRRIVPGGDLTARASIIDLIMANASASAAAAAAALVDAVAASSISMSIECFTTISNGWKGRDRGANRQEGWA